MCALTSKYKRKIAVYLPAPTIIVKHKDSSSYGGCEVDFGVATECFDGKIFHVLHNGIIQDTHGQTRCVSSIAKCQSVKNCYVILSSYVRVEVNTDIGIIVYVNQPVAAFPSVKMLT